MGEKIEGGRKEGRKYHRLPGDRIITKSHIPLVGHLPPPKFWFHSTISRALPGPGPIPCLASRGGGPGEGENSSRSRDWFGRGGCGPGYGKDDL